MIICMLVTEYFIKYSNRSSPIPDERSAFASCVTTQSNLPTLFITVRVIDEPAALNISYDFNARRELF